MPVPSGPRVTHPLIASDRIEGTLVCRLDGTQLGTIERCVRLWSNEGETILSPFAGIGSEGYESVRLSRRFIGVELKPSYYRAACNNLEAAVVKAAEAKRNLFTEAVG